MKHILFALLVGCTLLTACASDEDAATTTKARSSAVETLPAENK